MTDTNSGAGKPRDRILGTARSLFRQCGIRGTGVDAIAETAGTNKMTLYRHFQSKDALIVACLQQATTEAELFWQRLETAAPGDPVGQLAAWVAQVEETIGDSRGCDVSNAAVELPEACDSVRQTISDFKKEQRLRLIRLCHDAGAVEAEQLADTLALLVEGARISKQTMGEGGPSGSFGRCAKMAVASFLAQGAVA